jgi:hypothetical protein
MRGGGSKEERTQSKPICRPGFPGPIKEKDTLAIAVSKKSNQKGQKDQNMAKGSNHFISVSKKAKWKPCSRQQITS